MDVRAEVPVDETALVAALQAGDRDVFRSLVTALNPGLTRLARTYVSDALADEIVQETWMAVLTSIDQFEQRSALKTWIFRIMLNKVRTLAKREAKIVPFTSMGPGSTNDTASVDPDRLVHPEFGRGYWPDAPPRWDQLPVDQLESAEVMEQIQQAVSRLPEAQREVLTLRDIEGWSAAETCEMLGLSSVNQRVLLHRARATVRALLEKGLA